MADFVHFVQQYSGILVDPSGRRYVARVYGACRPDDLWDGWLVFFPLDGGRALATDRETTQSTLAAVRDWASGITTVNLDGALERARNLLPEARLARRRAQAEQEDELARAEAGVYEEAATAARFQALDAERRRIEAEESLRAEREAVARAAARLHDRAAARHARHDASEAKRRRRESVRQHAGRRRASTESARAQAPESAPRSRRRKGKT